MPGRLLVEALVPVDRTQSVEATLLSSLSSPEERVRQSAIRTTAKTIPILDTFSEPLTKLAETGNQDALNAIADILLMYMKEMQNQTKFNDWLRLLCKLSPSSSCGYAVLTISCAG